MKFITECKQLIKPLQRVNSVLRTRSAVSILDNLLLQVIEGNLFLTGTDLEVEIVVQLALPGDFDPGAITVPARKFYEICRGLPESATLAVSVDNAKVMIRSGRSSYAIASLPASDFPSLEIRKYEIDITLPRSNLKQLIELTQFCMANQDVRYYLNGMLFEFKGDKLRTVATDGHRIALCTVSIGTTVDSYSVIVPRKGVNELLRVLGNQKDLIRLQISSNSMRVSVDNYTLTSKLIDGNFPKYRNVLPNTPEKVLIVNRLAFKQALHRASILSNEKLRIVQLYFNTNYLKISANNAAQDEAEEILDIAYLYKEMEISFNVNYILDVLNVLKCETVKLLLTDEVSSIQIEDNTSQAAIYVIMPIRL